MSTFYDRLLAEKQELDERIEKLTSFMNSDKIHSIDYAQIPLLKIQLQIMISYSDILGKRISFLPEPAQA